MALSVSGLLFVIALAIAIDDVVTARLRRTRPAESPASENGLGGSDTGPQLRGSGMRALLATLIAAAALIAAVAAYGMSAHCAVSVVPGWHTSILAPYAVVALVGFAVLLTVTLAVVFTHFAGAKDAREP
ncbi:MAG TPA: hypothetical protein VF705_02250 [Longimicrobium sp.]